MMNKIVCDVCGTSYPETVTQCPICGTAKTDANKTTTGGETGYAYVKGGRFSHANVRKRNAGNKELPRVVAPVKQPKEAPKQEPAAEKPAKPARQPRPQAPVKKEAPKKQRRSYANLVLAIIAFLLVIGIVAVFAYFVKGYLDANQPTVPSTSTASQSTKPQDNRIPCTGIRFALGAKTFNSLDEKFQLSVILDPANTTDTTEQVWFESSNELVATVDEKGIVTPVGDGEAVITAHLGEYSAECVITCKVGFIPTTPPDPNGTTAPTVPDVVLELNRTDFTLNGYGDSHVLYSGELDPAEIIWTTSDEKVAIVTNGKVVAVGNGNATITAEYQGQKVTCEVHCSNVVVSNYELHTRYGLGNDFTISVGDTITLFMVEKETGLRIQAENLIFALSKEGVITIDENGKITAIATGSVTVTVVYGEHTLKAKVHVKKAK